MVGPVAEDLVDHRRIFDACPERVEGAAMIFKAPPQFGQCSTSMSKTCLSSRAQLIGAGALCGAGNDLTAQLRVGRQNAMEANQMETDERISFI